MSALTRFQPKLTPGHLRYHIDDQKVIDGYLNCDGSIVLRDTYNVLFDNLGAIITSNIANGILQTSSTSNNINELLYANNTFVYATDNGIVATSTDASTWTPRNSVIDFGQRATYVGGKTTGRAGSTSTVGVSLLDLTGGANNQPVEGDLVVIALSVAANTDTLQTITGYTQIASLRANDTNDTDLFVGYKIMDFDPDTSVTLPSSGGVDFAQTVAIQVWRNVEIANTTTVTQTNTVLANPPAITTTTANNTLLVIGAGAHTAGVQTYTAAYLSNFLTTGIGDLFDSTIGFGSIIQATAGTYDPAAFTFSTTDSATYSAAAVTIALKPAVNIKALIHGSNTFVFAGSSGVLATSLNAATWTTRTSGTSNTNSINALVYANNTFVYAGDYGILATSTDAITWTQRTSGTSDKINTLAYGNNTFVYAGDNGVLATSNDAVTWTRKELYSPISYVGGKTFTSTASTSLTDLTGGIASAPAPGDMVVIALTDSGTFSSPSIAGYTVLETIFSSDTYSTTLWVGYKIMGNTADTLVSAISGEQAGAIQVWRNVSSLRISPTSATNSVLANPPAITTTTANNVLLVIGAGGHVAGAATYGASYLSNFLTVGFNSTIDSTIGMGSIALATAGTYDPATFTFSTTDATTYSYAAATIALIPRNDNIKTLTYANNTFVYSNGTGLMTSSNANTWTPITSGVQTNYVGGKTFARAGSAATPIDISLTDLTGGIASAPAAGDWVIVAIAVGCNTSVSSALDQGYNQIADQFSADTVSTDLWVGYKVMGSTPDTTVTIGPSGSALFAQTVAIQVWRNIADYNAVANTNIDSFLPTPARITTDTDNDVVLVIGAAGHTAAAATYSRFSAPYLENFDTISFGDTFSSIIGMGSIVIPKIDTYDPATFQFLGATDSTDYSTVSITIALKVKNVNSITYDTFGKKFAFSTSAGDIKYGDLTSFTTINSKTFADLRSITYNKGFLLYAGQVGVLGITSDFNYDPNIEFVLPTSNNIFNDTFNSFTPTAFIKYE